MIVGILLLVSFFHRVLSFCMSVYIYWLSAQKMKWINKKLKSSLLLKWVMFVSGMHLESLSHLSPVARTWMVQKWACWGACEDLVVSLFEGSNAFQNLSQTKEHFPGTLTWWAWIPVSVPWTHDGVRAAWPYSRVRRHPQGERPPCAWLMPPDLHSPRIWLRRSVLSYSFCDFFKKISFVFFQLCSGGGLVSITRLPLPESQLFP